jgi:hypothetical protein
MDAESLRAARFMRWEQTAKFDLVRSGILPRASRGNAKQFSIGNMRSQADEILMNLQLDLCCGHGDVW